MMKPILFNTEMVQAIREVRKTVTRRLVKGYALEHLITDTDGSVTGIYHQDEGCVVPLSVFAPCNSGDILYVRETWRIRNMIGDYADNTRQAEIEFKAGGTITIPVPKSKMQKFEKFRTGAKWRPSIHMPKEAARLFLRVKSVRVERLQDIDDAGVAAEGLEVGCFFDELWDSTIKKSDRSTYGYDANPWVWVIEFERCEKPEATP